MVARRLFAALVVVAGFALTGCAGLLDPPVPLPTGSPTPTPTVTPTVTPTPTPTVTPSPPAGATVAVRDNVFEPGVAEITAGQTVTWVWEGNASHDVDGDGFDSGVLSKGATFSKQFTTAGTYAYVCNIHGGMNGTVEVKPAA